MAPTGIPEFAAATGLSRAIHFWLKAELNFQTVGSHYCFACVGLKDKSWKMDDIQVAIAG
jgi:hypothetical protein